MREWDRKGRPIPPPHLIKQRTLLYYRKKFKLKVLVESGTFHGEMVEAMKNSFDHIYSIELSRNLFEKARERFQNAQNIQLICGDSGKTIINIINSINKPTLFWLDGHFSGKETVRGEKDTPILEELDHILNWQNKNFVIIIDDARCFGSDPAYPTIEQLKKFVQLKNSEIMISRQDDILRITPALPLESDWPSSFRKWLTEKFIGTRI
jgi:hypothetical protein